MGQTINQSHQGIVRLNVTMEPFIEQQRRQFMSCGLHFWWPILSSRTPQ